GEAARVVLRKRLQLDGGVGTQEIGGRLLGIDAEVEEQGVVDDVLGEFELGVEHVIAGGPADFDAVGAGDPLPAGFVSLEPTEVVFAEEPGPRPGDVEAKEGDPTREESHRTPQSI